LSARRLFSGIGFCTELQGRGGGNRVPSPLAGGRLGRGSSVSYRVSTPIPTFPLPGGRRLIPSPCKDVTSTHSPGEPLIFQYVVTLKGLGQRPGRMLHESAPTSSRPSPNSKRAQKVENVLLLFCGEPAEVLDHLFRFGIAAVMRLDRFHQVAGTPVVQQKDPLPEAP